MLLEEALAERRPSFKEAHAAFTEKYGPSPLREEDFAGLRSKDMGRPPPFGEDFLDEEDASEDPEVGGAPGAED